MLYIKNKYIFVLGILIIIIMLFLHQTLENTIIRPIMYFIGGLIISSSLGFHEEN